MAPSDEGAVERLRETEGERLPCVKGGPRSAGRGDCYFPLQESNQSAPKGFRLPTEPASLGFVGGPAFKIATGEMNSPCKNSPLRSEFAGKARPGSRRVPATRLRWARAGAPGSGSHLPRQREAFLKSPRPCGAPPFAQGGLLRCGARPCTCEQAGAPSVEKIRFCAACKGEVTSPKEAGAIPRCARRNFFDATPC